MDLGLVYLLSHAHNRLAYEPRFNGYDDLLGDIFKCKITDNNQVEYAHNLKKASDDLLEKVAETYQKSKKKRRSSKNSWNKKSKRRDNYLH